MTVAPDLNLDTLKARLQKAVDRLEPDLEELSLRIHAHPEIAFQEHQAAQWLSERLEAEGFEIERGVGGLDTAFTARYRGGEGPTLAILAEFDALPGIGHGCGHNIIGTSAVGAALGLKQAWPDLPGEILLVGTPAEESGGGKAYLLEAGIFKDVSAAVMVHPSMKTQVVQSTLARQEIVVEYSGKAAHASAMPQDGINALDALVVAYVGIAALRQHIRSDAWIHGIITNGGAVPNVVPDHASGWFHVRARDDEYLDQLVQRVLACFRSGAEATGATVEYRFPGKRYSAMRCNPTLAGLFRDNLHLLGLEETPDPKRGSASGDIGNVSRVVPSLIPSIAIAPMGVPAHSVEFSQYACSPAGMQGQSYAAKAMALTIADLLARPDLLAAAADEFRRGVVVEPGAAH
jgi:amidohydrolase